MEHAQTLKGMSVSRMERHLESLLESLSSMEEEDLTTFELNFLRCFSENPPTRIRGSEERLI